MGRSHRTPAQARGGPAINAFTAGALVVSASQATAGCNSGSAANSNLLSSPNCQAAATAVSATALGNNAQGGGFRSTAIGVNAIAFQNYSTAVGAISGAVSITAGVGSTAIGAFAGASGSGVWSIAIGAGEDTSLGAHALGGGSIAIGAGDINFPGARASGNAAVAIGNRSVAGADGYASAFGYNAGADVGLAPTAIGTDSTA